MAGNKLSFPVGYFPFHEDEGLNFQLNRFYTYGAFTYDELMDISKKIDSIKKWISVFTAAGKQAEENADHHCQVGNMGLLLDTITDWIEEKKQWQGKQC